MLLIYWVHTTTASLVPQTEGRSHRQNRLSTYMMQTKVRNFATASYTILHELSLSSEVRFLYLPCFTPLSTRYVSKPRHIHRRGGSNERHVDGCSRTIVLVALTYNVYRIPQTNSMWKANKPPVLQHRPCLLICSVPASPIHLAPTLQILISNLCILLSISNLQEI